MSGVYSKKLYTKIHRAIFDRTDPNPEVAVMNVLRLFDVYESDHYCNPGCEPDCDIGKVKTWTYREVTERRKPLTEEELADIERWLGEGGRESDGRSTS